MDDSDTDTRVYPRPLRAYQWLVILLLLALASGVRAGPIYKCVEPGGPVAYQDVPCAQTQRALSIELAPAPAWQPSPQYAVAEAGAARRERHAAARDRADAAAQSFECRAADGQVFYRHSGCPHSVAATQAGAAHLRGARTGAARSASASASVSVAASRIARSDACHEIERAGAIGRSGHENDERVSTYERNLGRDPCR
jgi:hypothetical protein